MPCATNSAFSLVRRGASARLIVCFGCSCGDCGPVGGSADADPARHRRSFASRKRTSMLAWSPATPWKTTNRSSMSRTDSAYGAENCLWGAPRIHGELLKLGLAVSERTVSRYLSGRPTTRSQTWRTFFAPCHFGGQILSPVMSADEEDIAFDASDASYRAAPTIDASCASIHGPNVDWGRSLQPSSFGVRLAQHHLPDCTPARNGGGRDPPRHLPLQSASRRRRRPFVVRANSTCATGGRMRSICRRVLDHVRS